MAIDLTPVTAAEMLVNRLELRDDVYPVLQRNDDTAGWLNVLTLDSSTYDWDLRQVTNVAVGKPYVRLRIIDAEGLRAALLKSEAVLYDGIRYKLSRLEKPFGVSRVWVWKLEELEEVTGA